MPSPISPTSPDDEPSWQATQLHHRRFPLRGARAPPGHLAGASSDDAAVLGSAFAPTNMLGRYVVRCRPLEKIARAAAAAERREGGGGDAGGAGRGRGWKSSGRRKKKGGGKGGKKGVKRAGRRGAGEVEDEDGAEGDATMVLEVLGLTGSKRGFRCAFRFGGVVEGVALLGGSRNGLERVVREEEGRGREGVGALDARRGEEGSEEDEEDGDEDDDGSSVASSASLTRSSSKDDDDDEEDEGEKEEEEEEEEKEEEEEEEEKEDEEEQEEDDDDTEDQPPRSSHAFEKNTFRTPKFFVRWRGTYTTTTTDTNSTSVSSSESKSISRFRPDSSASAPDPPTSIATAPTPHTTPSTSTPSTIPGTRTRTSRELQLPLQNTGFLEFADAKCRSFTGTWTFPGLGLREVRVRGWKVGAGGAGGGDGVWSWS